MAPIRSDIFIDIHTAAAIKQIQAMQAAMSKFYQQMNLENKQALATQQALTKSFVQTINGIKGLSAAQQTITGTTDRFTSALERNKLSLRELARYSAGGMLEGGLGRALSKRSSLIRNAFAQEREVLKRAYKDRVKLLQSQFITQTAPGRIGQTQAIRITPTSLKSLDSLTKKTTSATAANKALSNSFADLATKAQYAAQRMQILNATVSKGATSLINWGKNTQWAGRQLMVGFTVPLVMVAALASKTFREMEQETVKFRKVYGDMFTDEGQTDAALENIMRIGKEFTKFGIAVKDTLAMAGDAAAAGFQGKALEAQVTQANRLSVLGQIEQQQALETTIALQNAFRISTEDLAGSIDFLNAVENQTVLSLDDITQAIPRVGPIITELGGDIKDLAFFLTAMKEGGVSAAQGANALKSGLASLINPSEKAQAVLAEYGVNIKGIVEANQGDLRATVVGFARALEPLSDLERSRSIEQVFGKFQFARISALFNNITTSGTQASRVLDLTTASVEELAIMARREMGTVEESVGVKFQKAIEELKMAIMPIGKLFLETLTPVIGFLQKVIERFTGLGDGVQKFIFIFGAAFPALLMALGLFGNLIGNVIKGLWGLNMIMARARNQSNILGTSFTYQNQEALENTALTKALGIEHSKLTAVFNVETAASQKLTAALAAQNTQLRALATNSANAALFIGGPRGAKAATPPKKFNKGTSKVKYYAKGTDTVPAMLTPGEAVIPADAAQDPRNKPIIKAMIAGEKIQGFAKGIAKVQGFANGTDIVRLTGNSERSKKGWETRRQKVIEAETKAREDATKKLKEEAKAKRNASAAKFAGRAGGALGIASMGAFMTGNAGVGMGLMGASMLSQFMPLLLNPFVAAGVAATVLGGSLFALNKAMDQRAKKEAKFIDSISATTEKMKKLGELTKTIGASEIMEERRNTQFLSQSYNVRERQGTQFGVQFLGSDVGANIFEGFTKNKDIYGTEKAAKDLALQLSAYISDGILSAEQANSVASQIAITLGDSTISTKIRGEIVELIGLNGQDLINNPLQARVNLIQESLSTAQNLAPDAANQFANITLGEGDKPWYLPEWQAKIRKGAAQLAGLAAVNAQFAQAQLDSFTIYYEEQIKSKKIALEATKDQQEKLRIQQEINTLTKQQITGEQQLRGEVVKSIDSSLEQFRQVRETNPFGLGSKSDMEDAYFDALKGKVKDTFKNTPFETGSNILLDNLKNLSNSNLFKQDEWKKSGFGTKEEAQEFEVEMQLLMANKLMNPDQITTMMSLFEGKLGKMRGVLDIAIEMQGAAGTAELTNVVNSMFGKTSSQKKLGQKIVTEVTALPSEEFKDTLKTLGLLQELDGKEINVPVMVRSLRQSGEFDDFVDMISAIEKLPNTTEKNIRQELTNIGFPEGGIQEIIKNWDYYSTLPEEVRRQAFQTFFSIYTFRTNFEDPAAKLAWRQQYAREQAEKTGAKLGSKQYDVYYTYHFNRTGNMSAEELAQLETRTKIGEFPTIDPVIPPVDSAKEDGKGKETSWLDEWVKKLRDVRDNTIEATNGFEASMKKLREVLGGKKDIKIFSGIEQDLTKLGLGQNFIKLMTGMDPEEYKKRKNDLFKFDNKGNIIALKEDAKVIKKAINEVALGEFQIKQMTLIQTTKDQTKAVRKLVAAGISATDAYRGVEDAAFAAAVANKKLTDKELQKIVRTWKKATKAAQIYAAQSGLAEKNAQFKGLQKTIKAIDKAREAYGNLPEEAIQEIIDNEDLRVLLLKGKFNDKELLDALQNAANKRELEIKLKMQTREGMQELFDEGYSKAMEWFAAQETKIELDFEFKTLKDQDIIEKAEDAIAALEYRIDDLQAELTEIEEIEELVNEKYDNRVKALEKVNEINQDILEQQKSQLTIADALTQGDIAAAARAVQDARQQQAERFAQQSRTGLDAARENELANIRNSLGKTRKQIEADIAKLQKEIFNIEEKSLEPAQERVRLAGIEKREAIQSLTLLGKSKLEWEAVKNQIDLAKTNSTLYQKSIELALDLVTDLVNAWNNMETTKTVFLNVIETFTPADRGGGGAPAEKDPEPKPKDPAPKTPGTTGNTSTTTAATTTAKTPATAAATTQSKNTGNAFIGPIPVGTIRTTTGYKSATPPSASAPKTSPTSIGGMTLKPPALSPISIGGITLTPPKSSPITSTYQIPKSTSTQPTMEDLYRDAQQYRAGGGMISKIKGYAMGGIVKVPRAEPPPAQTMNMGGVVPKYMPMGGLVPYMNMGGIFKPKGTDTVPAMLTPGEFVIRKYAVKDFGLDKLKAINEGTYSDGSVYNYNLNVNVKSESDPDDIANAVMMQIKRIDAQRIRGNRF